MWTTRTKTRTATKWSSCSDWSVFECTAAAAANEDADAALKLASSVPWQGTCSRCPFRQACSSWAHSYSTGWRKKN